MEYKMNPKTTEQKKTKQNKTKQNRTKQKQEKEERKETNITYNKTEPYHSKQN